MSLRCRWLTGCGEPPIGIESEAICSDRAPHAAVDSLGLPFFRSVEIYGPGDTQFLKLGRSRRIPRVAVVELAAARLRGGNRFG